MPVFPSNGPLTAVPHATLRSLTMQPSGVTAEARIQLLRQAGYGGGSEMAQAFERHVLSAGGPKPDELPLEQFNARVAEFFEQSGWGRLAASALHDVVAAVDIADCWEARMHGASVTPCCHVSTGVLAAFFSSFAPFALGAIEVECAAAGRDRCRFLLGSADVLEELYEHLSRGEDYGAALAQLSETSASA